MRAVPRTTVVQSSRVVLPSGQSTETREAGMPEFQSHRGPVHPALHRIRVDESTVEHYRGLEMSGKPSQT